MPKAPQQDSYFIHKLYEAIGAVSKQTKQEGHPLVQWDSTGKSFIVHDERAFTFTVLSSEFGISRFDSFARKVHFPKSQLNKYGFKRSKVEGNRIRFFHKQFNRDGKYPNKKYRFLDNIRKLSKEETLPKHIKLQLIRSKRQQITGKQQNNEKTKSTWETSLTNHQEEVQSSLADIDIYLNKEANTLKHTIS